MNRIIKFRYWNDVSKMMVTNPEMPYKKGWTVEELFSDRGWNWMQFTGLKDKNGKEIYEGDIVEFDAPHAKEKSEVFYKNAGFFVRYMVTYDKEIIKSIGNAYGEWGLAGAVSENLEVIGNIYENPEWLK